MNQCIKGKGAVFGLSAPAGTTVEIPPAATVAWNIHRENNTKIMGRCGREHFIYNPIGTDEITMKKKGVYLITVDIQAQPSPDMVMAFIVGGRYYRLPFFYGTSATARVVVKDENESGVLKNVSMSTFNIDTSYVDPNLPLVKITMTYMGC